MRYRIGLVLALTTVLFVAFCSQAQARPRGFTCGVYMASLFPGVASKIYAPLARNWAQLPRTSVQPGAVVVSSRKGRALGGGPGGHVVKVVQPLDNCTAVVQDNRGTYKRNICKNRIAVVDPGGEVSRRVTQRAGEVPLRKNNARTASAGRLNGIVIRAEHF